MSESIPPQPLSSLRLLSGCVAVAVPAAAGFAGVWQLAALAAGDFMKHVPSWALPRWEGVAGAFLFFAVFSYDLLRRYRAPRAAAWKKNLRFGDCWTQANDIMDENAGNYALFLLVALFWAAGAIGFILLCAAMLIGMAGFGFSGLSGLLLLMLRYVGAVALLPPVAFAFLPRLAVAAALFLALAARRQRKEV